MVVMAVAALSACVSPSGGAPGSVPAPSGSPPQGVADAPDAAVQAEATRAGERTRPVRPSRVTFRWRAREPDFRGSGFGVARVEPPYRARLDLFLDNGETAAIAALVDDELRIPQSLPTELVPPAPLLWAALGVFRPGAGAEMLQGRLDRGAMEVTYRLPVGGQVRFRLRDGALLDAEVIEDRSVVERVFVADLDRDESYPGQATYRNLPDYRELRLTLESVEDVDPFPADIWTPSGP